MSYCGDLFVVCFVCGCRLAVRCFCCFGLFGCLVFALRCVCVYVNVVLLACWGCLFCFLILFGFLWFDVVSLWWFSVVASCCVGVLMLLVVILFYCYYFGFWIVVKLDFVLLWLFGLVIVDVAFLCLLLYC